MKRVSVLVNVLRHQTFDQSSIQKCACSKMTQAIYFPFIISNTTKDALYFSAFARYISRMDRVNECGEIFFEVECAMCISCIHIKWQVALVSMVFLQENVRKTVREEKEEGRETEISGATKIQMHSCALQSTSTIYNNWSHVNEAKFSH